MTELALRPRSSTEIIDLAVRLLRRHFRPMFTIAVVSVLPGLLVQLGFLLTTGGNVAASTGAGAAIGGPANFIVGSLVLAALVNYADDVLRTGAGDVGSAFSRAGQRLPAVLGSSLLSALAILVGFILLVVPGVYAAVRLSTALPAVAVEGAGAVESLRRAWARGEGHVGHTFVTLLLLGLVALVFFVIIGIVATVAGVVGALAVRGGSSGGSGVVTFVLTQVVTALVTAALYPLYTNTLLLLAYDLRVRREGYDVEAMAAALGTAG